MMCIKKLQLTRLLLNEKTSRKRIIARKNPLKVFNFSISIMSKSGPEPLQCYKRTFHQINSLDISLR